VERDRHGDFACGMETGNGGPWALRSIVAAPLSMPKPQLRAIATSCSEQSRYRGDIRLILLLDPARDLAHRPLKAQ
jgi:hypothetical protein